MSSLLKVLYTYDHPEIHPIPSILADFPAVFFHICHGTQQAVVTPYRAYQNVWAPISDRNELFEPFFFAKYPCLTFEKWTLVIILCQGVHRRRLGGRFCSPWCDCSPFPGWTRKWGAARQGWGLASLHGGWASRCWFIILWWCFHHPGLEFDPWVHQYKYKYNMLVFCADDVIRWTLYPCSVVR